MVARSIAGYVMPIAPYLDGRFFDPETNQAMSLAFENVCTQLGLSG
jgi:hypothetical protein